MDSQRAATASPSAGTNDPILGDDNQLDDQRQGRHMYHGGDLSPVPAVQTGAGVGGAPGGGPGDGCEA